MTLILSVSLPLSWTQLEIQKMKQKKKTLNKCKIRLVDRTMKQENQSNIKAVFTWRDEFEGECEHEFV